MQTPLFDQDQATELLRSVERVSGLGGTLFIPDDDGEGVRVLFSSNACSGKCPHCPNHAEGATDVWALPCQRVHHRAAHFAERFGGRYFYQCSEDRLFFAAPIIADAALVAAMTVGPVHIYELEDAYSDRPDLRPFPIRKPAFIHHLSVLFAACAVSVSDSSQSLLRIMRSVTMEQQREIHGVVSRGKKAPVREYSITLEDSLVAAVQDGNTVTARSLLNELLGMLLSTQGPAGLAHLRERMQDLITVCSRAALRAGASSETVFSVTAEANHELAYAHSNEQMCFCIQRSIEQMVVLVERLRSVDYEDDIYRAVEYVLAHYDKKVLLEDVASEAGFSPTYFSRRFKSLYGSNFSAFLTQVRIDASKNTLLATDLPISEVALQSGFDDASYFTRTFKRVVGVTPGFFRSHRGQVDKNKELNLVGERHVVPGRR